MANQRQFIIWRKKAAFINVCESLMNKNIFHTSKIDQNSEFITKLGVDKGNELSFVLVENIWGDKAAT